MNEIVLFFLLAFPMEVNKEENGFMMDYYEYLCCLDYEYYVDNYGFCCEGCMDEY